MRAVDAHIAGQDRGGLVGDGIPVDGKSRGWVFGLGHRLASRLLGRQLSKDPAYDRARGGTYALTLQAPARARFAALETFRSPGYRCLWGASLLWNQARWMDQVVIGWVVLEITNSAWDVAV